MAFIVEVPNPFEPTVMIKHTHPGGITIRDWLESRHPGFVEFNTPTICVVNGIPKMRKDWGRIIQPDDKIVFAAQPQGVFLIVVVVVILVILLTILIDIPKPAGSGPVADPVYSTKGQQNSIRVGQPIEVCYGRNRIYPSFATIPYFQYVDNEQFQYVVFCLGQGYYDVDQILISDTDINSYQEVEYELVDPGGEVTLFPVDVFTSIEPGNIEALAPDDPLYASPGWVGPFVACPVGEQISKIEFDVVFPKGCYFLDSKGITQGFTVTLEAEARLIDNSGAPLGSYFSLVTPSSYDITFATNTPQRRTFSKDVPHGRYEVRLRRTSTAQFDPRRNSQMIWEGLRGFQLGRFFAPDDFGNVTLLAVKIRASNNLNNQTEIQFNAIATRKLPMRIPGDTSADSTGWTPPIATRSIIWAFVDVFKSTYGGRITDDNFFDWDTLTALDAIYEGRNEHFDWCFRDPITCWEAAKTIANVGRAVPLLVGSLISMKREAPQTIPVTMFSQENVTKGDFKWGVKLFGLDEYDSVRMEYTEPSTGYKQETVLCTLPGGTTDHPQDVRYSGCQNRDHAHRDGLFLLAKTKKTREQIKFTTGMEGLIVTYGDLVAISHDVPKWSQSGIVMDAILESGDNYLLTLSEPLNWSDPGTHKIAFRGKKAEWVGPYTAYAMPDLHQVVVHIPRDSTGDYDFQLTGKTEPVIYMFGVEGNIGKLGRIISMEPQGGENVEIIAVNYDETIFSYDAVATPALIPGASSIKAADLPSISNLRITQMDANLPVVLIQWTAAPGIKSYTVQTSTDGANWQDRGETKQTSIQVTAQWGQLFVRVSAVGGGAGSWIYADLTLKQMTEVQLYTAFDALDWKVGWDQVLNASGYQLRIYDYTDSALPLKRTVDLDAEQVALGGSAYNFSSRVFAYDYTEAGVDGNVVREMLIEIESKFAGELSGDISRRVISNPIPSAPTSPGSVAVGNIGGNRRYTLSWNVPHEDDLVRLAVWLETTNGFDPNVATPIYDNTLGSPDWTALIASLDVDIPLVAGAHAARYWRVAVFDVWGNEISTNITAQQTIAAYP